MKTYTNYEDLLRDSDQQLHAEALLVKAQIIDWTGIPAKIQLSSALREQICTDIAELLGGQKKTQERVKFILDTEIRQHWGLRRIILEKHLDEKPRWVYIAGQDCPSEKAEIRNYFK